MKFTLPVIVESTSEYNPMSRSPPFTRVAMEYDGLPPDGAISPAVFGFFTFPKASYNWKVLS